MFDAVDDMIAASERVVLPSTVGTSRFERPKLQPCRRRAAYAVATHTVVVKLLLLHQRIHLPCRAESKYSPQEAPEISSTGEDSAIVVEYNHCKAPVNAEPLGRQHAMGYQVPQDMRTSNVWPVPQCIHSYFRSTG